MLFVSGELNIIDRDDISQTEWHGRLDLLKHILYLEYYEWLGILQLYITIINQIKLGVKNWGSNSFEERALVLLPYALSDLRDHLPAAQSTRCPTWVFYLHSGVYPNTVDSISNLIKNPLS